MDVVNSYEVRFSFETTMLSTVVFALTGDAAVSMAADQISADLGYTYLGALDRSEDVFVRVLDRNVL